MDSRSSRRSRAPTTSAGSTARAASPSTRSLRPSGSLPRTAVAATHSSPATSAPHSLLPPASISTRATRSSTSSSDFRTALPGTFGAMDAPGPENLVAAARMAGVRDERVLAALRTVPRALFVPPSEIERAYADAPLPIPHEQVTTQPSLVAKMVEALALTGSERVLEIGTGYGWQTALLASLAGFVWSVERWPDLAEAARSLTLARFVPLVGRHGFPAKGADAV